MADGLGSPHAVQMQHGLGDPQIDQTQANGLGPTFRDQYIPLLIRTLTAMASYFDPSIHTIDAAGRRNQPVQTSVIQSVGVESE